MAATRITPKTIIMIVAGEVLLLATLIILAKAGFITRSRYLVDVVALSFGALARAISVKLFLDIANEYRNVRLSRLAWQALAVNAALLFIRGVASSSLPGLFMESYRGSPLRGLLNYGLEVPATLFLLLGLLGMLHAYRRTGLGPKLGRGHYAVVLASVVLFGWVLISHKNLEEGQSPWLINRLLQPLDMALIAVASVVSIELHAYAVRLNGGKLAEAMRWLVIYGLLPGVVVLLVQLVVPALRSRFALDSAPFLSLWALIPWAMTMAAVVRVQMTVETVAQVAEFHSAKAIAVPELTAKG